MRFERWVYSVTVRLRSLFRRGRVEDELAEEYRYHVDRHIEAGCARGLTPSDARDEAMRAMDGLAQQVERSREAKGLHHVDRLVRDLRYAVRLLRRDPAFGVLAIGCLALGIGAATAIFSVIHAVVLAPLPLPNPLALVELAYSTPDGSELPHSSSGDGITFSYTTYERLRADVRGAEVFGRVPLGMDNENVAIGEASGATAGDGEMVTGGYFHALGVRPLLGRLLTDADVEPSAPRAAVIGYRRWVTQFGRDPAVVGRTITLNRLAFTVVGVTPPEFRGIDAARLPDVWLPLRDEPGLTPWGIEPQGGSIRATPRWWWLKLMARVKPGVSADQARAELDTVFARHLPEVIAAGAGSPKASIHLLTAGRGLSSLRKRFAASLWVLLGAVGVVLLIGCANLATLLLARGTSRQRELGIRLATGASRGCIIGQLMTESAVVALAGGALGLLMAFWLGPLLLHLMSDTAEARLIDVSPNGTVAAACAAVSLVAGLAFGAIPALRATRVDLSATLKAAPSTGSRRGRLGHALVVGQVASLLVLLVGAGLLARTLGNLERVDVGFDRGRLLLFALDARHDRTDESAVFRTYGQVLESLQALPGVRRATSSTLPLLDGWTSYGSMAVDRPQSVSQPFGEVYWNLVGPSFARTLGIDVVLGRDIEWGDIRDRRMVALVNDSLARHFFPGQNPIGRRFSLGQTFVESQAIEIIGVVRDAKYGTLKDAPPRTLYAPYVLGNASPMHFELRADGDPRTLVAGVREAVRRVDPQLPLKEVRTMDEQVGRNLAGQRMLAYFSSGFGTLALILVAAGLYGSLAYQVAARTREIGIRLALGATRGQVVWSIAAESLAVTLGGMAIGLPLALAGTRLITSRLYGVGHADGWTLAGACLVLVAVALAAAVVPARRASRVEPLVALRQD